MMLTMKLRLLTWLLTATFALAAPMAAYAQDEEEDKIYDARLEGYTTPVTLDSKSTALTWLLTGFLAAVCVGVMFKNANRSHLD
jgi:hypothetical protein